MQTHRLPSKELEEEYNYDFHVRATSLLRMSLIGRWLLLFVLSRVIVVVKQQVLFPPQQNNVVYK